MKPNSARRSRGALAALSLLAALVVCGAVAGTVLAARLISADPQTGHAHAGGGKKQARTHAVGDDVPTSFGFIAVEHAETIRGLTARELGGAAHGIGSLVTRDQALVQASITITNFTPSTLRYSPNQFRLVATNAKGKVRRYDLAHATVQRGILQPDAAVDARLSFVAVRDGSRFAIEFDDPGAKSPVTINLVNGAGRVTEKDRRLLDENHANQDHSTTHGTDAAGHAGE
jgi:hypothetical protein